MLPEDTHTGVHPHKQGWAIAQQQVNGNNLSSLSSRAVGEEGRAV